MTDDDPKPLAFYTSECGQTGTHNLVIALDEVERASLDELHERGDVSQLETLTAIAEFRHRFIPRIVDDIDQPDTECIVYVTRAWGGLSGPHSESYLIGVYATLGEAKHAAEAKFDLTPEWEDVCEVGDPPCGWDAAFTDYWSVMIVPMPFRPA